MKVRRYPRLALTHFQYAVTNKKHPERLFRRAFFTHTVHTPHIRIVALSKALIYNGSANFTEGMSKLCLSFIGSGSASTSTSRNKKIFFSCIKCYLRDKTTE
jgi:hypothetical protein